MRGAASEGVEGTKTGRLECVSVAWHVEKKIGSRAANGCLDALIWHFERQTATLLPSHRRRVVVVVVSGGGISLSWKVPTDRFLEFSLRVQQSEEFERKINFIRYFAPDIFSHLRHAVARSAVWFLSVNVQATHKYVVAYQQSSRASPVFFSLTRSSFLKRLSIILMRLLTSGEDLGRDVTFVDFKS